MLPRTLYLRGLKTEEASRDKLEWALDEIDKLRNICTRKFDSSLVIYKKELEIAKSNEEPFTSYADQSMARSFSKGPDMFKPLESRIRSKLLLLDPSIEKE